MTFEDKLFYVGSPFFVIGIVLLIVGYASKNYEESKTNDGEKEKDRKRIIAGWSMIVVGVAILLLLFYRLYIKYKR
jgi:uncharacterized membrane protein YidH (DUF202 family)